MEKEPTKRLVSTWEALTKDNDGEAQIHTLHKYAVQPPELDLADFLHQAAPVRISPSRAKSVERGYETTLFFSDTQIGYRYIDGEYLPIHDESAMVCFRALAKHIRPDKLINLGDSVDFPTLSRFDPSSNHFDTTQSMQMSLDRAHRYWAELIADNPQAERVEVDSNHTVRVGRAALKALSQFYGVRQAGASPEDAPFLTYAWLMNFKDLGVQFDGGYGAAEYMVYPDVLAKHGKESRGNAGSTAQMNSKKYYGLSTVQGHDHRYQMQTTTDRDGNYRTHVVVPALCDTWGMVDGYNAAVDHMGHPVRRAQGWQQGALELRRYPDGENQWLPLFIKDGISHYGDREFNGNKEPSNGKTT